jgi:hypothetical protein
MTICNTGSFGKIIEIYINFVINFIYYKFIKATPGEGTGKNYNYLILIDFFYILSHI